MKPTCRWRILNSARIRLLRCLIPCEIRDLIVLLVHLTTTLLRIARPGGLRSVIAESVPSDRLPGPPVVDQSANQLSERQCHTKISQHETNVGHLFTEQCAFTSPD